MFESNSERKIKEALNRESAGIVLIPNPETGKTEEWIWVEGYKGTDKDMKCRGYQYEIGKQYDMPDDAVIKECDNGFHLCMTLKDVFIYYSIGDGRRFFKVRALVRKADLEKYGKEDRMEFVSSFQHYWHLGVIFNSAGAIVLTSYIKDKLVARSIEFMRELSIDEILADTEAANFPEKYKNIAIEESVYRARRRYENESKVDNLINLGYCEAFANYVVHDICEYDIAFAVGMQKDLSMDMKVFTIMKEACDT